MVVKNVQLCTEQKIIPSFVQRSLIHFLFFVLRYFFLQRSSLSCLKLYFITNVNKRKDFERKDKKKLNSEEKIEEKNAINDIRTNI